jgi:WD40 repeat protein
MMQAIYVWQLENGKRQDLKSDIFGTALLVAFSPDGEILVSASLSSLQKWTTAQWQGESRQQPLTFTPSAIDFTPDGVLVIGMATGAVEFWDPTRWQRLGASAPEGGAIAQIAASPDGWRLTTVLPSEVRIWGGVPDTASAERITGLRVSGTVLLPLGTQEDSAYPKVARPDGDSEAADFWRIWLRCCRQQIAVKPASFWPWSMSGESPGLTELRHWVDQHPSHTLARTATRRLVLRSNGSKTSGLRAPRPHAIAYR